MLVLARLSAGRRKSQATARRRMLAGSRKLLEGEEESLEEPELCCSSWMLIRSFMGGSSVHPVV